MSMHLFFLGHNLYFFLAGDSQVSYLYARHKFQLNEVEFSIYGTANILLGLVGKLFRKSINF